MHRKVCPEVSLYMIHTLHYCQTTTYRRDVYRIVRDEAAVVASIYPPSTIAVCGHCAVYTYVYVYLDSRFNPVGATLYYAYVYLDIGTIYSNLPGVSGVCLHLPERLARLRSYTCIGEDDPFSSSKSRATPTYQRSH